MTRVKVGDRVTPIFSQTFLHGQYDPDYQKSGLGGGLDGVLREYFACDREFDRFVLLPTPHLSLSSTLQSLNLLS